MKFTILYIAHKWSIMEHIRLPLCVCARLIERVIERPNILLNIHVTNVYKFNAQIDANEDHQLYFQQWMFEQRKRRRLELIKLSMSRYWKVINTRVSFRVMIKYYNYWLFYELFGHVWWFIIRKNGGEQNNRRRKNSRIKWKHRLRWRRLQSQQKQQQQWEQYDSQR